jgi:hypothetical protein
VDTVEIGANIERYQDFKWLFEGINAKTNYE